jgi:hypothetical protein
VKGCILKDLLQRNSSDAERQDLEGATASLWWGITTRKGGPLEDSHGKTGNPGRKDLEGESASL